MANYKKEIKDSTVQTLDYIGKQIRKRFREIGISKHAFCLKNGFCRHTFDRVYYGEKMVSFNSFVEYLDALDLEVKIVKKDDDEAED